MYQKETGIGGVDDGTRSGAMVEGCAKMLISEANLASKQASKVPSFLNLFVLKASEPAESSCGANCEYAPPPTTKRDSSCVQST